MTDVYLDEEAKEVLRQMHRRVHGGKKAVGGASQAPVRAAEEVAVTALVLKDPEVEGTGAAAKIAHLKAQAEGWAAARSLGTLREAMVFSCGDPEADLMLVGEAPGYQEERQREPFVGPAGEKLNAILKAMGLEREAIYLSNIVKFRPAMKGQTTNNRKPTAEEMATCLPFIRAEVGVVRPKCIVALGGTAAEGLLGLTGAVGKMREQWHEFEGIPVRVTYHPAYLLHGTAGQRDKRRIWEDMLAVMEKLGQPISERQRGFFLSKE